MAYLVQVVSSMAMAILATVIITTTAAAVTVLVPTNMTTASNTAKPGCPRQCGPLTVPYPFGIGLSSGCSSSSVYEIFCDVSFDPPKAFSPTITDRNRAWVEVLSISDTQIRIRNPLVAYSCDNSSSTGVASLELPPNAPYILSATANSLTVVGCDDLGTVHGGVPANVDLDPFVHDLGEIHSCSTYCSRLENVVPDCYHHKGCCQVRLISESPASTYEVFHQTAVPDRSLVGIESRKPCACGYVFVAAMGSFAFRGASDLNDSTFVDRVRDNVPVVLDWVVGPNKTCSQAQQDPITYACAKNNTVCVDGKSGLGGYHCACRDGFEGNPYLDPGCTDIDECAGQHNCSRSCFNIPGSYYCSPCPSGYSGDGRKDGTGCKRLFPILQVALGVSFGLTIFIIGIALMVYASRSRRLVKRRNYIFQHNGGFLLKQFLSSKFFTIEELTIATNNFDKDCILGEGGYGTVYKGVLPSNQIVAIKKSKVVDKSQIEQFINEVVLLTRANHPNVVKLLGCCLETEVPLLVYEFISNGTLYQHLHVEGWPSWLSWSNCVRIATESANALAYLHTIPIIHRDIKSANILLDDNYASKISDFGASRLIPMDQTQYSTLVLGTLGYLDPEYFSSGLLSDKSDVYSFGVVLAELLTREPTISLERPTEERSLAVYFLKAMKVGRLIEITDPQLVNEASQDQVIIMGELIQSCLSAKGEDRPTMKRVAMVLEELYVQASKESMDNLCYEET